ncbi:type I toxin-antitoxin system Ibs family toxin [Escherichia coli]
MMKHVIIVVLLVISFPAY